jgi:hypothetical protein
MKVFNLVKLCAFLSVSTCVMASDGIPLLSVDVLRSVLASTPEAPTAPAPAPSNNQEVHIPDNRDIIAQNNAYNEASQAAMRVAEVAVATDPTPTTGVSDGISAISSIITLFPVGQQPAN